MPTYSRKCLNTIHVRVTVKLIHLYIHGYCTINIIPFLYVVPKSGDCFPVVLAKLQRKCSDFDTRSTEIIYYFSK